MKNGLPEKRAEKAIKQSEQWTNINGFKIEFYPGHCQVFQDVLATTQIAVIVCNVSERKTSELHSCNIISKMI